MQVCRTRGFGSKVSTRLISRFPTFKRRFASLVDAVYEDIIKKNDRSRPSSRRKISKSQSAIGRFLSQISLIIFCFPTIRTGKARTIRSPFPEIVARTCHQPWMNKLKHTSKTANRPVSPSLAIFKLPSTAIFFTINSLLP